MKNNCHLEFCDKYLSYCCEHTRLKPPNCLKTFCKLALEECFVCCEKMGNHFDLSTWAPVCSSCNLGFVHRNCLKAYAVSSGYYFKCVACASDTYRSEAALMGIYIPET